MYTHAGSFGSCKNKNKQVCKFRVKRHAAIRTSCFKLGFATQVYHSMFGLKIEIKSHGIFNRLEKVKEFYTKYCVKNKTLEKIEENTRKVREIYQSDNVRTMNIDSPDIMTTLNSHI